LSLAIFDLDNTLIGGDSDVLWGEYLGENGLVDADVHNRTHQQFYQDYLHGVLDIDAFLRFQLEVLTRYDRDTLEGLRSHFMQEKIVPVMLPKAEALLRKHREQGDRLLIITATNRFVTEPIAHSLGVDQLIASEPEMINDRYTGRVSGIPSYAEGKVTRLHIWLDQSGETLEDSWFYSDSRNDLPLLMEVDHPVAVDPDEVLATAARDNHWPVISLR